MDIHNSVAFSLGHKETVIERFYERFLADYLEVRHYSDGIDLRQQAVMLAMALVVVETYYVGDYAATEHYLHVIGHRHHLANVLKEHYPQFRDSLLQTMAEIHEEHWDDDLAREWNAAINKTIDAMLVGYDRPYIY